MSREWCRYRLECTSCAADGELGIWSDDWGRWDIEMDGFSGRVWIVGPRPEDLVCEACRGRNPKIEPLKTI